MCGESWLTLKPTVPILKAGHPGVLFIGCTVRVCCVGSGFPSILLFLYNYLSYIVCYTHVFYFHVQVYDVTFLDRLC